LFYWWVIELPKFGVDVVEGAPDIAEKEQNDRAAIDDLMRSPCPGRVDGRAP
jgi:hypothetical protein